MDSPLTQLLVGTVEALRERYPALDAFEATDAVVRSHEAIQQFGLADHPGADRLLMLSADREARLRLGLERDEARLDPETHRRQGG